MTIVDETFKNSESWDESQPNLEPGPEAQTKKNFIAFGIHLQKALYVDLKVRKVFRVFKYKEIQKKYSLLAHAQVMSINRRTLRSIQIPL